MPSNDNVSLELASKTGLLPDHLSPKDFERFLVTIPKFRIYVKAHQHPPMRSSQLQMFFKIMYFCALRVSEVINLKKSDFDLTNRIVHLRDSKTGKGKVQSTSIPPPLLPDLTKFLSWFREDDEKLFYISRKSIHQYCMEIADTAGIRIFEELEGGKEMHHVYPHIFRKSYIKFLDDNGTSDSLLIRKGRWTSKFMFQRYTKKSITALVLWEEKLFKEKLSTVSNLFY